MKLDMMTPRQAMIAQRVLDEEARQRHHLVVYLSGAHAYGFPSEDSDLDLKAVHIAPTRLLVGLEPPRLSFSRFEIIEGVEIDYTSNELGPVLAGILEGNGNYIERILGTLSMMRSAEHEALRLLMPGALSRKVFRHYAGFARNQFAAAFESDRPPTAKRVLYVLRTALTGTHLLRTAELVIDVRELMHEYGMGHAEELIRIKQSAEKVGLEQGLAARWRADLEGVLGRLEEARAASCLPEEPAQVAALEGWLQGVRKQLW